MDKDAILKKLYTVKDLNADINGALAFINELRHTKIIASYDGSSPGGSSFSGSKVETAVLRIEKNEAILNEKIQAMSEAIKEASELIDLIDSPIIKALFIARFLNLMTFEQVAEKLEMSGSQIFRLYNKGLEEISQKTKVNN